jgi:hypothetical protein
MEEVEDAIAKLKNHKALGEDTITTKLIKHRGLTLLRKIHELMLDMEARRNAS